MKKSPSGTDVILSIGSINVILAIGAVLGLAACPNSSEPKSREVAVDKIAVDARLRMGKLELPKECLESSGSLRECQGLIEDEMDQLIMEKVGAETGCELPNEADLAEQESYENGTDEIIDFSSSYTSVSRFWDCVDPSRNNSDSGSADTGGGTG